LLLSLCSSFANYMAETWLMPDALTGFFDRLGPAPLGAGPQPVEKVQQKLGFFIQMR